ncbi:MAG: bifunctional folylpolyglutamate synthase/dihydrofolate synthase, partial [Betaproteobacteria bacterium]|nr:bifunctional folylpolyglutamate synthase/dihydrofolate synthase [Betaproteobacteria bacterium]
ILGHDRDSIGREKAGILRAGRPAVLSDPVPPQSVIDAAQALGADLWRLGRDFNFSGDKQQWAWAGRGRRYAGMAYPALRGANQLVNASGVLAALEALRPRIPVTAQAVRNGLAMVELPGRFQIVPGQPVLVLDVAHNPHSVAALTENLDAMGFYPTTHAVFGAMADKDLAPMLQRVGPLIDRWYFCDLPLPRAAKAQALQAAWQGGHARRDATSSVHPNPLQALQAAVAAADPADRIVVFGSFYTVGGVLQDGVPRLQAKHLSP